MKKISIVLLAVFFIGIANVNAQTDVNTETVVGIEEVKTCAKTGKVCDATCEKKKNGTCCKGEKKKSCSKSEKATCSKSKAKCSKSKSSCSKSKDDGFNFNKTNNYGGEKSSCSKKAKKGCCKKKAKKCDENCTKPCCAPPTIGEATPAVIEEVVPENE